MKPPKKIILRDKEFEKTLRVLFEDIYEQLTSQKDDFSSFQNEVKEEFRGDISSYDWTQATLTLDGAWHTLDCSSIVPAGAKTITFRVNVSDNSTEIAFGIRPYGRENTIVADWIITQVANIEVRKNMRVPCDELRKVQYWGTNTTWTQVDVAVIGWSF